MVGIEILSKTPANARNSLSIATCIVLYQPYGKRTKNHTKIMACEEQSAKTLLRVSGLGFRGSGMHPMQNELKPNPRNPRPRPDFML